MKTNLAIKQPQVFTAQGAIAARIGPEQELRRTVAACMLWESGFYESGESIADRIKSLVPKCRPEYVAACAYEAMCRCCWCVKWRVFHLIGFWWQSCWPM